MPDARSSSAMGTSVAAQSPRSSLLRVWQPRCRRIVGWRASDGGLGVWSYQQGSAQVRQDHKEDLPVGEDGLAFTQRLLQAAAKPAK